jgi:hypothetical protein
MYVETSKNAYGTPIDCYICETCGDPFTLCPANEDRSCDDQWTGCMATICASYDPARDADKLFDNGNVVSFSQRANPTLIRREPVNGR